MTSNAITFLLNEQLITTGSVGADDTLLDFLRIDQRLTGTKEGCAEGDCGACTVLVGRLRDGVPRYEPINACIRFLAACHGCHVVTIEHLRGADGGLHPVQQAMVDHHGSQCGFCTPGIVMSLYALWMGNADPGRDEIETALQGNLCRCTGYAPIIRAAEAAARAGGQAMDRLRQERDAVTAALQGIGAETVEVSKGDTTAIVPGDVAAFSTLYADNPKGMVVAGATDVGLWVTKFMRPISPAIHIAHLEELARIEEGDSHLNIGAAVSYSDAQERLCAEYPTLRPYWMRIGGWQVRNAGTIGGNIANGSPIGDTPPVLIALGTEITLRHRDQRRRIALEDFFIEYGKQDRQPGEWVEAVHVPKAQGDRVEAWKISKRRDEDISSVAMGVRLRTQGETVTEARIALGGMAGVPKRAAQAEAALTGRPLDATSVADAAAALGCEFTPLTDWRASKEYRMAVAKNLLQRLLVTEGAV